MIEEETDEVKDDQENHLEKDLHILEENSEKKNHTEKKKSFERENHSDHHPHMWAKKMFDPKKVFEITSQGNHSKDKIRRANFAKR